MIDEEKSHVTQPIRQHLPNHNTLGSIIGEHPSFGLHGENGL